MGVLFIIFVIFVVAILIAFLTVPKIDPTTARGVDDLPTWKQTLHLFLFGSPFKKFACDLEKNLPNIKMDNLKVVVDQRHVDTYKRSLQLKSEAQAPALLDGAIPAGFMGTMGVRLGYATLLKCVDFQHFHLLGIILRGVKVTIYKIPKIGAEYKIDVSLDPLQYVKKGADIIGGGTLTDKNGTPYVKAQLVGLKMFKHKKPIPPPKERKTFNEDNVVKSFEWEVGADQPLTWLETSGDPNPIHMHPLLAKLFGLKSNIMHGTWIFSKALSYFEKDFGEGQWQIEMKFVNPMNLPSTKKKKAVFKVYKTENKGEFDLVVWVPKRGELVPGSVGFMKKID